jgi:hypothetical protein
MNRRNFLRGLAAVVGGVAIDQAIPLGRVWSFPREIKIAPSGVRILRSWKPGESALMNRIDAILGFNMADPELDYRVGYVPARLIESLEAISAI